jgi:hypothetical protein
LFNSALRHRFIADPATYFYLQRCAWQNFTGSLTYDPPHPRLGLHFLLVYEGTREEKTVAGNYKAVIAVECIQNVPPAKNRLACE